MEFSHPHDERFASPGISHSLRVWLDGTIPDQRSLDAAGGLGIDWTQPGADPGHDGGNAEMKIFTSLRVPFLLSFGICLVLGFSLGTSISRSKGNAASYKEIVSSHSLSSSLPTGQRNILLISIDQLTAPKPRLESVWMVLYIPGDPSITLVPIFPVAGSAPSSQYPDLQNKFELGPDHAPTKKFIEGLKALNLWWDHYLVLDEMAQVELINRLGQITTRNNPVNGLRAVANLPLAWVNPHGALLAQATLLKEICREVAQVNPDVKWGQSRLLEEMSDHLMTDMTMAQVQSEWKVMASSEGQLSCSFPTLSQAVSQP